MEPLTNKTNDAEKLIADLEKLKEQREGSRKTLINKISTLVTSNTNSSYQSNNK
jgi:hypothetical protein